MDKKVERVFIMVKPEGLQRQLVGDIIKIFERKGLKLLALKLIIPSKEIIEGHLEESKGKPFFNSLVDYMMGNPVVCMIWKGLNACALGRKIIGNSRPLTDYVIAEPGSIRGDFAINFYLNTCHCSDSVESAEREIKLWFKPEEIQT